MTHIKTWAERCEEHPDNAGVVTSATIQARMQEEIDELRAALDAPLSQEQVQATWIATRSVNGVPCIYDFAQRVRRIR